jgi:hypothetical protein
VTDDQQFDSSLQSAGARWRGSRPNGPDLAETLAQVVTEQPSSQLPQRGIKRWVLPAAVAALVVAGAAVPLLIIHSHGRSVNAGRAGTALVTCGPQPVSDGPHAKTVQLAVTVPKTAPSGGRISAQVAVTTAGATVELTTALPPQLIILQDGQIVGRYLGPSSAVGASVPVSHTTQRLQASIALRGCGSETALQQDPAYQPPFLPAGDYQLMAVAPDLPLDASAISDKVLASPTVDFTISGS